MAYGIRIRRNAASPWRRGKQYWRAAPGKPWRFWRDTFPSKAVAEHRLKQLQNRGWQGHVFEIVAYPNATHYSRNFTRAELDCKCGCRTPRAIARELALLAADLERMRGALGHRLAILSGYRCPAHNAAVGGASQSQHMTGNAADVSVPAGHQPRYVAAAKKVLAFRMGGIGVYPGGGVHVDRRGWVARWDSWSRS